MTKDAKSDPVYPWVIGAIFLLVSIAVILSSVFQKPNAPRVTYSSASGESSPLASLNPAQRAARTIMSSTENTKGKTAGRLLDVAFAQANATFGKRVIQHYSIGPGQTLNIYVNDSAWHELSEADQNTVFAAAASSWATIWQQTTGKRLHNGLLMELRDQSGHEIRRDTFQEQL